MVKDLVNKLVVSTLPSECRGVNAAQVLLTARNIQRSRASAQRVAVMSEVALRGLFAGK